MSSQIDETFPADNVVVAKADMREQFAVIKEEIEELQQLSALPRRLAIEPFTTF